MLKYLVLKFPQVFHEGRWVPNCSMDTKDSNTGELVTGITIIYSTLPTINKIFSKQDLYTDTLLCYDTVSTIP